MSPDRHPQFEQTIDEMLVAGPPAIGDSPAAAQLRHHLASCSACRDYLDTGRRAIAALNSFSFPVDPALSGTITAALRLRATQLEARKLSGRTVMLASLAALIFTLAGSFIDMRLSGLLATVFEVQRTQIQQGLLTFWIGPSLCLLLVFPLLPLLGPRKKGLL